MLEIILFVASLTFRFIWPRGKLGSAARFINHSCSANSSLVEWLSARLPGVLVPRIAVARPVKR